MSSTSLKYGHIIRIKPNDPQIISYITSKSYTDPKLYFQTYGFEETPQRIDVSNYRQSLFEVLPTSSFEINDQMNGFKSQAKKAQTAPRAKTQEQQFKTLIEQKKGKSIFFGDKVVFKHLDSKHYVYGSVDCAQSGIGAFKIDLRRELSQNLVFKLFSYRTYEKDGDQISLDAPLKIYHFQTQCYLSYCMEPIFLDRDSARMSTQGQNYEYGSICPQPYLRLFYTQKAQDYQIISQEFQQEQKSKVAKEVITDQTCRFQIINQNIAKRIWKFEMYLDVEMKPNKQIIRNHDIVYLLHTKDDKYLSPDNFTEDIFLKKRLQVSDPDFIFDGLWQIQERVQTSVDENQTALKNRFSAGEKKGLGSSFYPLMSLNMSFRKTNMIGGSQVQKKDDRQKPKNEQVTYSLRHLMSGRIIYYLQNTKKNRQSISTHLVHPNDDKYKSQNEDEKYGIVLLECLESNLIDGALTRLSIQNGKHYLEVKSDKKNEIAIKSKEDVVDNQMEQLQKLKNQINFEQDDQVEQTYEANFEKQSLEAVKDASQHGFRIYKIDESIKQIALMVMSSQEIIQKFIKLLHYFDADSPNDMKCYNMTILNTVINVIRGLIGFIYDCDYTKIATSGNSPNPLRQRAFDEIGMVQLITTLIDEINFKDRTLNQTSNKFNKLSQYRKVRTIYTLGYEILESVAASNPLMKIKISKYLQIYLDHILIPENRVVYRSIQQILDGNQLALEKKVQQKYIHSLIETFMKPDTVTDPADLQFLSTLCLCKNRTVQKNQNAVYLYFYQENGNQDNKFFFQQDHGKYQISSKITKKQIPRLRTLPQLYLQCQMSQMDGVVDPSKGHWNYFIQYLNLLADVCVHRNISPLKYISQNLPLKTLQEFLQQKLVRNKLLHQPFIRLVHHAFVQNENYKQINRIAKVKSWNNLGDFSIPKSKYPVNREINNIINIVVDYIKKINLKPWEQKKKQLSPDDQPQSIQFDPENMTALKNVNTFLQILKSTLVLGFWPSMDQLKKLVPYMLKILSFDIQYANRIANNPKVRKSIVHVSEQDLLNKVYKRVKQQLRLNKSNITLLVQCKILAAKILSVIIDYEFNIRVSMITKHFKDVQQQEVNLKDYPYKQFQFKKKWKNDKQYQIFRPENQKEGYLMNQKLWIDKIDEIISRGNVFQYCGQATQNGTQGIDWMLSLFEGFIYGDKELTDIMLDILIRTTNERKQMLNTFKDIILVAGGNLNKLTDRVLTVRNSLLKLDTQQVYYQTYAKGNLWKKFNQGPSTEGNHPGTIQQLAFLTISMKKNETQTLSRASKLYSMTDLYPFINFDEVALIPMEQIQRDHSYLIITQKDQNNPLNQNLIKSQDHHVIILNFIKLMQKIPKQKFPIMALHASYNFLTTLVWNNIENKNQLDHFLAQAQSHLSLNVGCIDFFQQMYKNNSKLVLKTDVGRIVSKIIEQANNQDIRYYHKSKLLNFLRTICVFDNKGIEKNQNTVMEIISQVQVSDNNQIVYLKVQDGISKTIDNNTDNWMEQYSKNYQNTFYNYVDLEISAEIFYVATFFEIFGCLIENNNKVNIGKCTNMHPHDFLIKTIRKYRSCWPVVRHLRSYINKLYYFESRDRDSQIFDQFITYQLDNIQQQLKGIVSLIANSPDYHLIKIASPIRYCFLGSYIFLALQQCLNSLNLMFECKQFTKHLSMNYLSQEGQQSESLYYLFFLLIQMLEHLMKIIDGRFINKYLATVSVHLKKAVSECPLKCAEKYNQNLKAKITQNITANNITAEDVPLKKNYIFHENKGFWRHLIDWNSTHQANQIRQSARDTLQKKTDISGGSESDNKKKREFMLQKIFYLNIDKLLLKRDPKPMSAFISGDKEEGGQQFANKDEKMEEGDSQLPKNLVTSQSQRFKVKNQRFSNAQIKNAIINARRKKLVKFIQVNPELSKYGHEQVMQKLYKGFSNLTDASINKYKIQVVGREDVIKTIVDMNRKDPKCIKLQFKVQIVKMLTSFIQKQSSTFQDQIQMWNITDPNQIQGLQKAQNFLNDCQCAQFLCSLFQNDMNQSIKMSNEIILFGICLLFNKNASVQNSILQILKKDDKNFILTQLQQLIKQNSNSIAYYKPYEAKYEYPIPMNYSDTYDFLVNTQKIMERKFNYIPETVLQQKQFQEKMRFLQRIFIFLKVLCQGNNQQIKNFIRDQAQGKQDRNINVQSINFVSLSASELKRLFNNFRMQILKVPFAIVDFINQVTRIPCIKNQLYLCQDTTYFYDFASLQKMIEGRKKNLSQQDILKIADLYAQNIKTCLSCLQGNHQRIRTSLISGDLNTYYAMIFKFFMTILPECDPDWSFGGQQDLEYKMSSKPTFEGKILRLFDITTVIKKLCLKYAKFKENVYYQLDKQEVQTYFEIFSANMLGIEINMQKTSQNNQQRHIEYFPYHPVYKYLSRTTRAIIMEQIDRNTQRDKIIGLIETTQEITEQINYNFQLDHTYQLSSYPIEISASKISKFQSIGLFFAVSISILMTILSTVIYYPDDEDIEYDLGNYFFFIQVLSILQFLFASLFVVLWYINHYKLALGKYQLLKKSSEKKDGKIEDPGPLQKIFFKVPSFKVLYCLALYDKEFPGIALFMFGSIMGTFYKPEWFSLLIMTIMMKKMSVLKNMVDSITSKIDILLMLSLLGTSFIAIFSIFSLTFYIKSLYQEQIPEQHCQSVFSCIKQLYVQGQINSQVQSFESGRFLFDMIYMIFMDILFNAIIGGILTDTFSQLAQKHDAIIQDKQNHCFICGITQQVLEKKNQDIKTHYKAENHKLWNYVFYIYNLNLKADKVGLDYIIQNKIQNEDVSWVPVQSGDEDDIGTRIEALQNAIIAQKQYIQKVQLSES